MTRTPPLDSAFATPACTATAADMTTAATATVSHLAGVRIEDASVSLVECVWADRPDGRRSTVAALPCPSGQCPAHPTTAPAHPARSRVGNRHRLGSPHR